MSDKRPHETEEPAIGSSNERPRTEALTFKNRDGEVESTHTWFASDDIVALRTVSINSEEHSSISLANRGIMCRDSLMFKDILSMPSPAAPKEEDVYTKGIR